MGDNHPRELIIIDWFEFVNCIPRRWILAIDVAGIFFAFNTLRTIESVNSTVHTIIWISSPVCPNDGQVKFSELIDKHFDMRNSVFDIYLIGVLHIFDDENVVSLMVSDVPAATNLEQMVCSFVIWIISYNKSLIVWQSF